MITERQTDILNKIIQEYIDLAEPVSSQLLEKKCGLGISPATIRIEMQKLTDAGFIYQPHTSAGRVPTDKGYRFFVDKSLTKEEFSELEEDFGIKGLFDKEFENTIKFVQSLTKNLASASSALVSSYLSQEKILWEEGWEGVFGEPEFKEKEQILNFTKFFRDFEENIENLEINSETELTFMEAKGKKSAKKSFSSFVSSSTRRTKFSSPIKIYIGEENPFSRTRDFSIIISKCRLPVDEAVTSSPPFAIARVKEEGILAILGPKRMAYNKNIGLINSLTKLLEEF